MTSFFPGFFDSKNKTDLLWQKKITNTKLLPSEILFQANLWQINHSKKKWDLFYFVLTNSHFYCLKSPENPEIIAFMETELVRTEFLKTPLFSPTEFSFCIRILKNGIFTDLFTSSESSLEKWKKNMNHTFIQTNFHQKYNTLKMIGKGSFARVYLIEDKLTKQQFAAKSFSKEYIRNQSKGKEALENEIKMMQQLKHYHVMQFHETHESEHSVYLVLELLEGSELISLIIELEEFSTDALRNIIHSIISALAHLEEKGVMHRDLKPENIILKNNANPEDCVVKIADFGLSTSVRLHEHLFVKCGTPGYMSPEAINADTELGVTYGPKCDVFSAGIIFYMMVTKQMAFHGRDEDEILSKNKEGKIDFNLKSLKKNQSVFDLVKKMLEINPEKRPSAKEVLKDPFFEQMKNNKETNFLLLENKVLIQKNINVTNNFKIKIADKKMLLVIIDKNEVEFLFQSQIENEHDLTEKVLNKINLLNSAVKTSRNGFYQEFIKADF